ncbi:hypothetical protein HNP84_008029 [Thermocatellispora tengchongensis]|uniref:Uncharacterized protein n=1 Tax=Thermocatellispora tengchongensis TaxID=1073253 RepID=A0A840PHF8_9ACTN|nr:hypothetical protein [Thermocatellispora tengchongensis]
MVRGAAAVLRAMRCVALSAGGGLRLVGGAAALPAGMGSVLGLRADAWCLWYLWPWSVLVLCSGGVAHHTHPPPAAPAAQRTSPSLGTGSGTGTEDRPTGDREPGTGRPGTGNREPADRGPGTGNRPTGDREPADRRPGTEDGGRGTGDRQHLPTPDGHTATTARQAPTTTAAPSPPPLTTPQPSCAPAHLRRAGPPPGPRDWPTATVGRRPREDVAFAQVPAHLSRFAEDPPLPDTRPQAGHHGRRTIRHPLGEWWT